MVAVTIIEAGIAQTLRGRADVHCGELPGAEFMAVVKVTVEAIDDHLRPETRIEAGVRWAFTDPATAERDRAVLAALDRYEIASRSRGAETVDGDEHGKSEVLAVSVDRPATLQTSADSTDDHRGDG